MAYISVTDETSNSFVVQMKGLDSAYTGITRYLKWTLSNGRESSDIALGSQISESPTYRFGGLDSGKTYTITAKIYTLGAGSWSQTFTGYGITEEEDPEEPDLPDPPKKWSWSNSNYTREAWTAINYGGKTTSFHHSVWNDLIDKVNEILEYQNKSWSSIYLTLANTEMGNDKTLTATRFNSLVYNLNRCGGNLSTVSKGSPVRGDLFIDLADEINSVIDEL